MWSIMIMIAFKMKMNIVNLIDKLYVVILKNGKLKYFHFNDGYESIKSVM